MIFIVLYWYLYLLPSLLNEGRFCRKFVYLFSYKISIWNESLVTAGRQKASSRVVQEGWDEMKLWTREVYVSDKDDNNDTDKWFLWLLLGTYENKLNFYGNFLSKFKINIYFSFNFIYFRRLLKLFSKNGGFLPNTI